MTQPRIILQQANKQHCICLQGQSCRQRQSRPRLLLLFAITFLLTLTLIGCAATQNSSAVAPNADASASGDDKTNTGSLNVVTTNFVLYDFAKTIGADAVNAKMLLKPGAELHSYEPTPQDVLAMQECDVFIYIGGESDAWVDAILASLDLSHMRILRMMDSVSPLAEEAINETETDTSTKIDAANDMVDAIYDEHIWTSPKNAINMVKVIGEVFSEVDSPHANLYLTNANTYISELTILNTELHDIVTFATHRTLVFGDRFPFLYLTRELGLNYFAAFPGCSTETDASPATIAFLIDKVKAGDIPVVLKVEMSSPQVAQLIAEASDAKVLTLHSVHNVTAQEMADGATYLSLMRQNLEVLCEALA